MLRQGTTLTLLWLSGAALRLTILVLPPLLPLIHRDLHLSETAIGTLGSLPSLLFACAAIPGALLIARVGARRTLVAGLFVTALGCALRGAASDIVALDLATIVMAAGIAVMQPALPPLARTWMPDRVGFATAVYSNGMVMAGLLGVALSMSVMETLAHGSWRFSLVLWAIPVAVTGVLVLLFAPRAVTTAPGVQRWWPDWRDPLVWRLGLLAGGANTVYWTANTFLPDYLVGLGRPELVAPVLTAFNGGQIPGSLFMLVGAGALLRRKSIYAVLGLVVLATLAGVLLGNDSAIVWSAGILGCANAVILVLALALPALLGAPEDVHRLSAAMFTVSFPCSVLLPILGGYAWDVTGIPALALAPVALGGAVIIALARGLPANARDSGIS
ncbi:MAG TPA: MFS transporter [Stellaceae bacterium]|jgi:CP family cyanate transporter-like MFS transporter|nr:MFS transporter [Stellaceae bacterium]